MNESILLPTLVGLPLLAGLGLFFLGSLPDRTVKLITLGVTLLALVVNLAAAFGGSFHWFGHTDPQLTFLQPWIKDFGVSFSFGADQISMSLVLLTTFLMPLTVLGAFGDIRQRVKEFCAWMLILQAAMTGVFVSQDLIQFFIFFELTLVPMYFLIGIFGGKDRKWASQKFFIFTMAGSAFTFAGILYVAALAAMPATPGGTWNWTFNIQELTLAAQSLPASTQALLLGALLAGFAVKVPLFPVHTWLPLAHTEAPTAGSVILAGVLLKLGTYGLLRFALPMAPLAVVEYAPAIAVLCIIGILYAALICWVQTDIKKLVAYSSVSHLGFCVLGMFALNVEGVSGSVAYMINHGLSTGALFLCVGMIYERYHTRDMEKLSGLGRRLPVWGTFMAFFCMASVGLPGLNGFVGEFLTVLGALYQKDLLGFWFAASAAVGMILAAIYILYMLGKVVLGPLKEPSEEGDHGHGAHGGHGHAKVQDLNAREIAVLTPIAIMCLVLGLYPTPMLKSIEEPIKANVISAAAREIQRRYPLDARAMDTKITTPPHVQVRGAAPTPAPVAQTR